MNKRAFLVLSTVSFLLTASAVNAQKNKPVSSMKVSSQSFTNGDTIPKEFTADGIDVSPPLKWSKAPEGTRSLALTCEDPDAPRGTWFHWIIFNMPSDKTSLEKDIKKNPKLTEGTVQGTNDFRKIGYNGPSPPKGPKHHYNFKVFALKKKLDLKPGCSKLQFYKAIQGNVLGKGVLTGTYQRL